MKVFKYFFIPKIYIQNFYKIINLYFHNPILYYYPYLYLHIINNISFLLIGDSIHVCIPKISEALLDDVPSYTFKLSRKVSITLFCAY